MEDFLNCIIAEVSKQHQALEKECGLLKNLLKPWPRKETVLDDRKNKEEITAPEVQKASENLNHYEKQALSEVDELLRKAEKMRQIKSKVKRDVDQGTNVNVCNIKNIDTADSYNSESPDSLVPNNISVSNKALDSKRNNHQAAKSSVSSTKAESSSEPTVEIQPSQLQSNLMRRNIYTSKNSCSATTEKSKDLRQKSYRPPSRKASSAKVRHVPAHMLAPFKTSDSIRFPQHKKSYISDHKSSPRTVSKQQVPVEVKAYKTLPEIAPQEHKRPAQMSDPCMNSVGHTGDTKYVNIEEISPALHTSKINTDFTEEEGLADHVPQQFSAADVNSNCPSTSSLKTTVDPSSSIHTVEKDLPSHTSDEAVSDLPQCEQKQFTLQKNGSSLKLPNKLIKVVNANRSLQDRLSSARLVNKVSAVEPAQSFVERLCAQEEISEELRTRVSALTCLRSHQILTDTLQSLHLDKLSESTSMEELYRAKRTLEFVLKTFAELQEEADYFSQVKYRQIEPVMEMNKTQADEPRTLWLDTGQKRDFQNDLWNHLQTSKRWAHLLFTEKYLQLNISLIKAAHAEWWKTITSVERDASILQGVYSFLTTHGQFLPAFVENPDFK